MRCHNGNPSTWRMTARGDEKAALDKLEYLFYSLVEELRLLPRKEMSPVLRSLVASPSSSLQIPLPVVPARARSPVHRWHAPEQPGIRLARMAQTMRQQDSCGQTLSKLAARSLGHAGKEQIQGQLCGFLLAIYVPSRFVTEGSIAATRQGEIQLRAARARALR